MKNLLATIAIVTMFILGWNGISPSDLFISVGLMAEDSEGQLIWGWEVEKPEHQEYTMFGKYASCGIVYGSDGNIWDYWQADIRDDMLVRITFDDNGTPDNIEDDIIINLEEESELRGDDSLYWLGYEEQ